jgi:hypothetical protein
MVLGESDCNMRHSATPMCGNLPKCREQGDNPGSSCSSDVTQDLRVCSHNIYAESLEPSNLSSLGFQNKGERWEKNVRYASLYGHGYRCFGSMLWAKISQITVY